MELAKLEDLTPIELNNTTVPGYGTLMQAVFKFDNGYGASVIHGRGTYGVELAVLIFDADGSYDLTHDTPVTGDVIGWIEDEAELLGLLREIQRLT